MHAPLDPKFRVESRPLTALDTIADEWRSLVSRALEPNVFYEPAFALAAMPVFGTDAVATLVWSGNGRLMGLFPARTRHGSMSGWTHPYAPLGVPLVDRDAPEAVIAAWLDHLADNRAMPSRLFMPLIAEDGPFAAALNAVLARSGRASAAFGRHQRALLDPTDGREGYLDHAVSTGRRKELRRLRRRLEDIAPVTFKTARAGEDIAAALKDFLVLEASGWKGLAQTAAANDAATRAFVESAVATLAAQGKARIDRVFLNGSAIAVAITLSSGNTAWCWKIAYNEGVARFSPGVQLIVDLTGSLLDDPQPARVDSCATADHPMIDHVWRERLAVSDRLIAVRQSVFSFTIACGIEHARRFTIATAKALRDRLRARKSAARAEQPADDLTGGRHRHLLDEGELARIFVRG